MTMLAGSWLLFWLFAVLGVICGVGPFIVPGCSSADRKTGLLVGFCMFCVMWVNIQDAYIWEEPGSDLLLVLSTTLIIIVRELYYVPA